MERVDRTVRVCRRVSHLIYDTIYNIVSLDVREASKVIYFWDIKGIKEIFS